MKIEQLLYIVKEASALMPDDVFEVSQKGGYANIVTSSDTAVQEFLCTRLAEILPGCGFLCEENNVNDLNHRHLWIIDPIDGTTNYARGIPQCAISVGLQSDGVMSMAAVFLPRTGEMFYAERGKGAWMRKYLPAGFQTQDAAFANSPDKSLKVSTRPFADSLFCTNMPLYHKEHAAECAAIIHETFCQCNDIRRLGSAASELCYLAAGRCDLYFEYLLSPWDFAASSLILTEAGGFLCKADASPLDVTKPSAVLAANNPDNLNRLQQIVAKHL